MKLTIKTKRVEMEYQDDYSMLEKEVKDRLLEVLKSVYQFEEVVNKPIYIHNTPEKLNK
jgi:hypothetical protein